VVGYTNIYKGKTLISRAEIANSNWQKCKGLMFSKQKDILFNFRKDAFLKFHMVFVFYPIDIVFMDHNQRIVDIKKRFCPFTFYYSRAKSSHVLELKNGTIEKTGLELGDLLIITTRDLTDEKGITQTSKKQPTKKKKTQKKTIKEAPKKKTVTKKKSVTKKKTVSRNKKTKTSKKK